MKSLLVALMVHLLNTQGNPTFGGEPVFVVPAQMIGAHGEVLPLKTSNVFGPLEKQKWNTVIKLAGSTKVAAELCYRSAYQDLKSGVAGMPAKDQQDLLMAAGGHHGLALVAVRWCDASLKKLDVLPLGHLEFASGERSVREQGYADDMAYLAACRGDCGKVVKAFAHGTVGVPLDAER